MGRPPKGRPRELHIIRGGARNELATSPLRLGGAPTPPANGPKASRKRAAARERATLVGRTNGARLPASSGDRSSRRLACIPTQQRRPPPARQITRQHQVNLIGVTQSQLVGLSGRAGAGGALAATPNWPYNTRSAVAGAACQYHTRAPVRAGRAKRVASSRLLDDAGRRALGECENESRPVSAPVCRRPARSQPDVRVAECHSNGRN
jgi:hypothetical protein